MGMCIPVYTVSCCRRLSSLKRKVCVFMFYHQNVETNILDEFFENEIS